MGKPTSSSSLRELCFGMISVDISVRVSPTVNVSCPLSHLGLSVVYREQMRHRHIGPGEIWQLAGYGIVHVALCNIFTLGDTGGKCQWGMCENWTWVPMIW